ncbi:tail fiber domain-containing protein, partial [Microgenomates group bacterium]|nr:tail fiber domain-containing protein [Microgenomates group bacterium]
ATSSAALSSLSASTSALILPYTVLGGADQEILTIDDTSTYPVLISQPTKILGNLYAPKFIDSDSETYFLDPSAADLSLSLAGNATISATLTFSKNGEYITNTTDNYLLFSGGLGVGGTTTYGFNDQGNINANKIEAHDIIQVDNLKLNTNTLSATNNDGLKLYDNDSKGIFIQDGGNVGIGTTGPGYTLTVSGTAWVTSGAWSGSDVRWKKDIQPIAGALGKVLQLSGVSYNWRKDEFPENKFDDKTHLGLVAQDVEKLFLNWLPPDPMAIKASISTD